MNIYIRPHDCIFLFYPVLREFLLWLLKGVVFVLPFLTMLPLLNDWVKEKYAFVRTYNIYINGS